MKGLVTTAAAALALIAAPMAQAADANRGSAPASDSNDFIGSGALIPLLVIAAAIAVTILVVADDNGSPDSP